MAKGFVTTDTILDRILARKVEEVVSHQQLTPLGQVQAAAQAAPTPCDFAAALRRDTVALIAEVKKASPSKGVLIEHFDPPAIARAYADNGAAAVSVLTDEAFFQGHLNHLRQVRAAVSLPTLRKEFVLDSYQIYEARAAGADAVLLIIMALEDALLTDLHAVITSLGMAALVEVHNEAELERALKIGAHLIGVNNRDLRTFHEDLTVTARLARLVPPAVTLVAESAIRTPDDVRRMGQFGARAVLVGETLIRADNMALRVRELSSQPFEVSYDQNQNLRSHHV